MLTKTRSKEIMAVLCSLNAECISSIDNTIQVRDVERLLTEANEVAAKSAKERSPELSEEMLILAEIEYAAKALSQIMGEMLNRERFRKAYTPKAVEVAEGAEPCVIDITTKKQVH